METCYQSTSSKFWSCIVDPTDTHTHVCTHAHTHTHRVTNCLVWELHSSGIWWGNARGSQYASVLMDKDAWHEACISFVHFLLTVGLNSGCIIVFPARYYQLGSHIDSEEKDNSNFFRRKTVHTLIRWETERSTYGLFRAHRCHLELNCKCQATYVLTDSIRKYEYSLNISRNTLFPEIWLINFFF